MSSFRPKYVTFDCYGTLTNFEMAEAARDLYGAVLPERAMADFIHVFAGPGQPRSRAGRSLLRPRRDRGDLPPARRVRSLSRVL